MPKLSPDLLLTFLALIKFTLVVALSYLYKFIIKLHQDYKENNSNHHPQDSCVEEEEDQRRPLPSMVPVPYISHVMSKLIKKKLPVIEFSKFQSRMEVGDDQFDSCCVICSSCIEEGQDIRLLGNCSHLYHKECMDEWLDYGHGTCPLCRLKLLPAAAGIDPWREERIAYLFGEDYVLHANF